MFIWSSIAHIIALTSPGPDTAIIIRQVTMHGKKSGYIAALGIGLGIYCHCLLAVNGISLIILANDKFKLIITIIGSSYLLYLGFQMLYSKAIQENDLKKNESTVASSFINGLITNLFNIKAFIFFVSLFTVLIDSINGIFFYIYPLYFAITSCLWFVVLSYLLSMDNKFLNIHKNKLINLIMGLVLCFIGFFILLNSLYEYF